MTGRSSRAGRDAGNTTGVATAVLALLSAGSLAALGLVTASDVRDAAGFPAPQAGPARVAPPVAVVVTPPARPDRGRPSRPADQPLVPVEPLPPAPPTGATPVAPGPDFAAAPSAPPAPEPPTGPVFAAVPPAVPAPSQATKVLSAKHGPSQPKDRSEHPGNRARVRSDHPVYTAYAPSALAKAAVRSLAEAAKPAKPVKPEEPGKPAEPAEDRGATARAVRPVLTVPVPVPSIAAMMETVPVPDDGNPAHGIVPGHPQGPGSR